ncbi:hypothetical protein [Corynebacterium stationis]|uniref:hypothetical protein n=1 Tax=Corynebacterium stationis TaxID=1705 RepID=UPI00174BDA78|nr:hypothetical protein [Corynebacterium stationis]
MKLFSRKALVAGAAAVALSFTGTSAAVAAEPANSSVSDLFGGLSSSSDEKKDDNTAAGSTANDDNDVDPEDDPKDPENDPKDPNNPEGDNGLSSQDPKDISAWISVFTAVIGALGALFAFASKHLGFKL